MFRLEFEVDGVIQWSVSGLNDRPFKEDFYEIRNPVKDSVFGWGFNVEDKMLYVASNDRCSKNSVATVKVFRDS